MKKIVVIFLLGSLFYNCGSKKRIAQQERNAKSNTERVAVNKNYEAPVKVYANATEQYIDTYKGIAQEEMRLYDIPASITIAQGILESGSGNGRLSVKANNHFGIKCHNWTGAKIYHDDDEKGECFRKYNSAKYSFRDHSLFLTMRERYAKLFSLKKDDYKNWAKGLRAAGYATDKKYPQKLISLIERYKLYEFDEEVLGMSKNNRDDMLVDNSKKLRVISNKATHVVVKGDTLYNISKKHNISVEVLKALNDLRDNNINIGQELQVSQN
jgi:flagellum-specific peptidoglycan hydrolase FlgJ